MRVIDADELAQGLTKISGKMEGAASRLAKSFAKLMQDVMFAPTIDAVPVVRCKDCKHRGTCDCPMLQEIEFYDEDDGWDYRYIDNTDDDGFCHNGSKMDGGAENA